MSGYGYESLLGCLLLVVKPVLTAPWKQKDIALIIYKTTLIMMQY